MENVAQGSDPFDQLEERMANPPKLWTPKGPPKDVEAAECVTERTVQGIVEEIDERTGDYGGYRAVVLRRRDASRVQVAAFGTVLGGRLRSIRVGDAIGLTYLGEKPSSTPGMQDYANYDVVILRSGLPVSASPPEGEPEAGDDFPA
jgi:hypothetical protein